MTTSITTQPDVLNELAGITPGSPLAELRAQRPEVATHAQGSYTALFDPADGALGFAIRRDVFRVAAGAIEFSRGFPAPGATSCKVRTARAHRPRSFQPLTQRLATRLLRRNRAPPRVRLTPRRLC